MIRNSFVSSNFRQSIRVQTQLIMSQKHTRYTSSSSFNTNLLIENFRSKITSRSPIIQYDTITPSQTQLFLMTLHPTAFDEQFSHPTINHEVDIDDIIPNGNTMIPRWNSIANICFDPITKLPRIGTPLPHGFHLAFFPPRIPEHHLALDGYDKDNSPPEPFIQRMWAGGDITWDLSNPIRIGDDCTLSTIVKDVQLKKNKQGNELIIVSIQNELSNEEGLCMTELRNYIYMHQTDSNISKKDINKVQDKNLQCNMKFSRIFKPTPISLFRFSALTFNSHLIHYNHPYAVGIEKHKDIIVHGPMNFVLLLELLRLNIRNKPIKRFTYRAICPLFSGENYTLNGNNNGDVWVENNNGYLAMKGKAEFA